MYRRPSLYVVFLSANSRTVKLVYNDHPWDPNLWPLLAGGRYSEVALCYEN
jgi:hypothetical protein